MKISFSRSGSSLKILIQDDGRGLDVNASDGCDRETDIIRSQGDV